MPASTKQKYSILMNGYEDKIKMLKKSFNDLKMSKNKINTNNYEDVKISEINLYKIIYELIKYFYFYQNN